MLTTYLVDAIVAIALRRRVLAVFPTLHVADDAHWLPLAPILGLCPILTDFGVAV